MAKIRCLHQGKLCVPPERLLLSRRQMLIGSAGAAAALGLPCWPFTAQADDWWSPFHVLARGLQLAAKVITQLADALNKIGETAKEVEDILNRDYMMKPPEALTVITNPTTSRQTFEADYRLSSPIQRGSFLDSEQLRQGVSTPTLDRAMIDYALRTPIVSQRYDSFVSPRHFAVFVVEGHNPDYGNYVTLLRDRNRNRSDATILRVY